MSSRHPAVDLLALVLHRVPALPEALCRGRSELFDSDDPADVAEAVSRCQCCLELGACRDWVGSLSYALRPPGVVAARHYRPRRRRGY